MFEIIIYILTTIVIVFGIEVCIYDLKFAKEIEEKYNVSKFPVTSRRGNQYYVEIKYDLDRYGGMMLFV